MILRVTITNFDPMDFAKFIQDARLSGTVFKSWGAGAWGIEPGSTAEFAISGDEYAKVMRAVQTILDMTHEQVAYITKANAHGTVAFLHWADGRTEMLGV